MIRRRIRHVDAFTETPLEGNPAAVVDGDGIAPDVMQRIARNQKLSETVFLLPPESAEDHARMRIFTPVVELPFAGHPTVAAAHVLVSEALVPLPPDATLRLECGAGVIPVHVAGDPPLYTMTQVAPAFAPATATHGEIARWVGLAAADVVLAEVVDTGIPWLVVQLASLEAMMRVRPDFSAMGDAEVSYFCIGAQSPGVQVHVRTFVPGGGIPEDPVTGSANGCIGALVAKHALLPETAGEIAYAAEQGDEMGQPGRVSVRVSDGGRTVRVGGHAVTVLTGEITVPEG